MVWGSSTGGTNAIKKSFTSWVLVGNKGRYIHICIISSLGSGVKYLSVSREYIVKEL